MPRKLGLDSKGYWAAYGGLNHRGYVPLLSLVGLARAMGVPASKPELRAYCYLASHAKSGYRLYRHGDTEQYKALRDFIEANIAGWYYDLDDPESVKAPRGMEKADAIERLADYVMVSSATLEQVGSMWPEQSEESRITTARRALKALEDSQAICRVYRGVKNRASLYAFLPIVTVDANDCAHHQWFKRVDDGWSNLELGDYCWDFEAMADADGGDYTWPDLPWSS